MVLFGLLADSVALAEPPVASIQTNIHAEKPTPPTPAPDVDLRPQFGRWGLGAQRQGKRPTCSVFTLAGALEFAVARHRQHGERLSVEFLNWAANQTRSKAGDGGCFSDLWKGFAAYGICAEPEMPYRPKFDPSAAPSVEALADAKRTLRLGLHLEWIKEWDVRTGLTHAQLLRIKRTLHWWPVCGGFRWPKQEKWESDVLQLCPPEAVRDGHSVLLVGYRDDANQPGGGLFLFRNTSRGGRDGWMSYRYAQTYMNDAAWIRPQAQGK